VIDALELDAPDGTGGWAILHRSTGVDGRPIAVSGLVLGPASDRAGAASGPAGGRSVLAWAHGTTGLADACAPSRAGLAGVGFEPLIDLARQGFIITATDYEGLGTPGLHPYLVGTSEGRAVLDSIRAAQAMPEAGAGSATAIVGISQGGHAALWAGELAPAYAPELDLRGIVAASPPIDLRAVQRSIYRSEATGEVSWLEALMVAAAWHETYRAPLEAFLTAEGLAVVRRLVDTCPWEIPGPVRDPFLVDPGLRRDWQALMEENSPGRTASRAPILVIAARSDEQVPAETIPAGIERLRAAGSRVELRWVEGLHADTLADPLSALAAFAWLTERLASGRRRGALASDDAAASNDAAAV
jgi:alpha-beta hydrolase superfamily lysophospholipase